MAALPRQRELCGLAPGQLELGQAALERLVAQHTQEAGLRGLERLLAKLCRRSARRVAEAEGAPGQAPGLGPLGPDQLAAHLGPPLFRPQELTQADLPGVAHGLAWTPAGGEVLSVEATSMPGRGQLILTGQLGDVMKESIEAARTVVRSRASSLGIAADKFEKHDMHIHLPEGATPKDGPSAGAALTTAMVSVLAGIPVRCDVAMTGEITLRGEVLPIGGLKEKLLAAHRGGIKQVLIPQDNVKDLVEIPDNIKNKLDIQPVKWIEEVLEFALERKPEPLPEEESKAATPAAKSEDAPAVIKH